MAEFCKQCTEELFGPDVKWDFRNLTNEEDTFVHKEFAVVLCEGCGPTLVDHDGKCVDPECEKHGEKE